MSKILAMERPYTFQSPFDDDHFVARWLAYASGRTDAAHEFHEAAALALLAAATPTVRARLAPYPGGLPTNIYTLLLGDSTTSRKSTTKDLARDVQALAIPDSLSADHFSPEGFIEMLASRPNDCTTVFIDEFGELLSKLHSKHMAGLRGLLLTCYSGDDYRYRRHSKRGKDGTRHDDADVIVGPHLSIVAATTPAVFETLTASDVTGGLLPRFAIVAPQRKPERKPFFAVTGDTELQRAALAADLQRLHRWSTDAPRPVNFAAAALDLLDAFAAALEAESASDILKAMLARLVPMAVKVAMLAAAGRPDATDRRDLDVSAADADAAITVARRWQAYATAFAQRIGESDFERIVRRVVRIVESRGRLPRTTIAQNTHVPKRVLDDVAATLMDRGLVKVTKTPKRGAPPLEEWIWVKGEGA
jgi:hypothetical protein